MKVHWCYRLVGGATVDSYLVVPLPLNQSPVGSEVGGLFPAWAVLEACIAPRKLRSYYVVVGHPLREIDIILLYRRDSGYYE